MPFPTWPELHGALTHFPVALIMTACIFELAAWAVKKPEWRVVSFWVLFLAVVTALPALVTGWMAGRLMFGRSGAPPSVFVLHRAMAFATTGLALALLVWRTITRDALKERALLGAMALVLVAALSVGFTGFLGGKMVFGGTEATQTAASTTAGRLSTPVASTRIPDRKLVVEGQSIFNQERCTGCHKMGGQGTAVGPDLTHEARRQPGMGWQMSHLKDPAGVRPGSIMPSYAKLGPAKLKALAAFLTTRK